MPSSTDEARISLSGIGFHTSTHVTEPSSRLSEKIRSNDEPSDFWTVRCWAVLTSLDTRSRSAAPIRTESRPTNFPANPRISGRGGGREIVGTPALRRLIVGPAGDDERLELALAEWRDRAEGGLDPIRCAADADGDLVVTNPGVARDVERRNEPVGGSEPQQAVS